MYGWMGRSSRIFSTSYSDLKGMDGAGRCIIIFLTMKLGR